MKPPDTSVPLGRRSPHSYLTSRVNEKSAYFHYQELRRVCHHPLQLPAVITFLLSPHINMNNLIASHPNNLSFSPAR